MQKWRNHYHLAQLMQVVIHSLEPKCVRYLRQNQALGWFFAKSSFFALIHRNLGYLGIGPADCS